MPCFADRATSLFNERRMLEASATLTSTPLLDSFYEDGLVEDNVFSILFCGDLASMAVGGVDSDRSQLKTNTRVTIKNTWHCERWLCVMQNKLFCMTHVTTLSLMIVAVLLCRFILSSTRQATRKTEAPAPSTLPAIGGGHPGWAGTATHCMRAALRAR